MCESVNKTIDTTNQNDEGRKKKKLERQCLNKG